MTISRRRMLVGALAAPVILKFATLPVRGQTAESTAQVIALQRVQAGDPVVTAISDGFGQIDAAFLSNTTPDEADALLAAKFMEPSPAVIGVNTYLVQSGDRTVLIDAGGAGFAPSMGNMLAGLAAAGVAPADVDDILLTHLHVDHIGALVTERQPTFANAVLHVHEKDLAYVTGATGLAAAPADFQAFFGGAKEMADIYGDRLQTFAGETEIVPGIASRELFGHTPGHCGFVIGGGDESLFVWGDVVHVGPIQMARPDVGVLFDVDAAAAVATRKRVLATLAEERTRIAGMHLTFPGIGHVVRLASGESYDFVASPWMYSLN